MYDSRTFSIQTHTQKKLMPLLFGQQRVYLYVRKLWFLLIIIHKSPFSFCVMCSYTYDHVLCEWANGQTSEREGWKKAEGHAH